MDKMNRLLFFDSAKVQQKNKAHNNIFKSFYKLFIPKILIYNKIICKYIQISIIFVL